MKLVRGALSIALLLPSPAMFADSARAALADALRGTQAAGVVLDLKTGVLVAQVGKPHRATPGSVIKPLLLEYALEHGIVTSGTQVYCDRRLHIAGRDVSCTHPADRNVFVAETALAGSCNRYFAELGRRFTGETLEAALREARVEHRVAPGADTEEREMTVLGLDDVTTTPLELAEAYRALMLRLPADGPVERGLRESVDYGMAHAAAVHETILLGKTGTAKNAGEAWTHGWFAGALPGRLVVVIYIPHGDGGTAAGLAHIFVSGMHGAGDQR